MPRRCTVCDHRDRETIDRLLVAGTVPVAALAVQHGLVARSLQRHATAHLPAALAAAQDAADVVRGDSLLERLRAANADTQAILQEVKKAKDYDLALKALARVEKQIELEARLLGELHDGATVNVFVGDAWQAAVAEILRVLAPHPALRLEVAGALRALAAAQGGREGQEVARVA